MYRITHLIFKKYTYINVRNKGQIAKNYMYVVKLYISEDTLTLQ